MAEKPDKNATAEAANAGEGADVASKKPGWKKLLPKRWLPALLILTLLCHGALVLCWRATPGGISATPSEIPLGDYRFVNAERSSRLAEAKFDVHVSLLLGTERSGGGRLEERKFLVQQGIEELLRQAHAADFDDPTLSELKRQIQEKVNEALEMRTVEGVIITNLQLADRQQDSQLQPTTPTIEKAVSSTRSEPGPRTVAGETHPGR